MDISGDMASDQFPGGGAVGVGVSELCGEGKEGDGC